MAQKIPKVLKQSLEMEAVFAIRLESVQIFKLKFNFVFINLTDYFTSTISEENSRPTRAWRSERYKLTLRMAAGSQMDV